MHYLPIEAILVLAICLMVFSVILRTNIRKLFHPAISYFLGVALFVFSIGFYFFSETKYTYKFEGTYPIEYSKGGDVTYFFQYKDDLYDAEKVVENFSSSSKKVYIYTSEENKSSIRSVFQPKLKLQFRSAEDTYILRINREGERLE